MKKKLENVRRSNTYKTFIISFLIVLLLPVFVFSFVFIRWDQKLYKEKILEQAELSLELPMKELEQYVTELGQICAQISLMSISNEQKLDQYESTNTLILQLAGYQLTHSFIQEIAFYNANVSKCIYTNCGTYSPVYYYQYVGEDGTLMLPEYLKTLKRSGWITPSELSHEGKNPENVLQYVMKKSSGESWVFTFYASELQKLLEQKNSITLLYDEDGRQLYPYEKIDMQELEAFCKISVRGKNGRLSIVRYLDSQVLFTEIKWLNQIYLGSLILILLLGGCISMGLAFWNDKPIQELLLFCESKVNDVPYMKDNFTVVRFTIDRMEQRMQMIQEQREKEHLLLQLFYGKNCDSPHFVNQLLRMKLFQRPGFFRVFLASADNALTEEKWDQQLCEKLEEQLPECEIYVMRYGRENSIGVMKIPEEQEDVFRIGMEEAVVALKRSLKSEIQMYVGGRYEQVSEIYLSYREVLSESQRNEGNQTAGIIFVDHVQKIDFLYPRVEIASLQESIRNRNVENTCLIMDFLCSNLEEISSNRFMCTALFCDVVRTIRRGIENLEVRDAVLLQLLDIEERQQPQNFEEMKSMLQKIQDEVTKLLEHMCEKTIPDNTFVNGVLTFISQNRDNKELNASLVAIHFGISVSSLSHRMKLATGRNVSDIIVEQRMEYAKELLLTTDYSVQAIADMIGYNHSSSFANRFKKVFSMTPLEYRISNRSNKTVRT